MIRGDGPLETETDYKTQKSTILTVSVKDSNLLYKRQHPFIEKA